MIDGKPDIIEVVERYVDLRRAGKEFRACCPFHAEKTPSFYVNDDKGVFLCRSCHAGGDVIRFVELIEGTDFRGALRQLGLNGQPALTAAQRRKREETREAARRIRYWAQGISTRIETRLRDIGGRAHMARKILRETPADADAELLKEELERCRREWKILCDLHDDIFNADFVVELWRMRDVIDAFVGKPDTEILGQWPPLTKEYVETTRAVVRGER